MYSEESLAFCAGQCQASRFPPTSCRCICQGRNHGILHRSGHVVNVTPYPYQNPYESFNREIPRLPEERLMLTARELGASIDGLKASLEPALRDEQNQDRASGKSDFDTRGGINLTKSRGKYRIAKGIGKALKHSIAGYSSDELNRRVRDGLRQQFNETNTDLAIFQAFQIRQSKQPDANRPELYELYETGEIDQALEMMGKSWHIGRPKR